MSVFNFIELAKDLDKYQTVSICPPEEVCTLSNFWPIHNQLEFESDALYIGTWEQLKQYQNPPKYIVCIGNTDQTVPYCLEHQIYAVIFPEDNELPKVFQLVQSTLYRYYKQQREIRSALSGNGSIETIFQKCADYLKGELLLVDLHGKPIIGTCHSDNYPQMVYRVTQSITQNQKFIRKLEFISKPGDPYGIYLQHLYFQASPMALLIIWGAEPALSRQMYGVVQELLEEIYPVLVRHAQLFSRKIHSGNNHWRQFFEADNQMNPLLKKHLDILDWNSEDSYRLLLLRSNNHILAAKNNLYLLEQQIGNLFYDCIMIETDDSIWIVLHNTKWTAKLTEQFRKLLVNTHTYCSVSNEIPGISHLPEMGKQGEQILQLYENQPFDSDCLIDCNTQYFQLTKRLAKDSISENVFCHPDISALWELTRETGKKYFDVFYMYLKKERNIKETAQALFMHRNTVYSYLNKIGEIIHADLTDPEERLYLLYSCYLMQQPLIDISSSTFI